MALADGIERMLSWSKAHEIPLAFESDALSLTALALESPDVIGKLVEAVVEGSVELVGGSYAAASGLFAGGESNIRNHSYGALALMRLICAPAQSYWQRDFDAFPQLPQILKSCGIVGSVLVQGRPGTTPEVPIEDEAIIVWQGIDGTCMPTISRTRTAPTPVSKYREGLATIHEDPGTTRALVTWLPWDSSAKSQRSLEMMREQVQALREAGDFAIDLPRQLFLDLQARAQEQGPLPIRAYSSDSLWHGQSLGVNGDRILRSCAQIETEILAVEALASLQPFLGKRDAWGEYPHWEIAEAWRALLTAQHGEIRQREGSLAGPALADLGRASCLLSDVRQRLETRLAKRTPSDRDGCIVINSLAWPRRIAVDKEHSETVPAFGWLALPQKSVENLEELRRTRLRLAPEDEQLVLSAAGLRVKLDRRRGVITQIISADFPQGLLDSKQELLAFSLRNDDGVERFESRVELRSDVRGVRIERHGKHGRLDLRIDIRENPARICVQLEGTDLPRPGCRPDLDDEYGEGSGASWARDGLSMPIVANLGASLGRVHDSPYALDLIDPQLTRTRRYPGPGGSAPVEETLRAPFTSMSLVDLVEPVSERGLLFLHDGGQGFFAERNGARALLSMWDPQSGGPYVGKLQTSFSFVPHGELTHEERRRLAAEHRSELRIIRGSAGDGQLPERFAGVQVEGEHSQVTAFFRESARHNDLLCEPALPGCSEPWILRLVEFDGIGGPLRLIFPRPISAAALSNVVGEQIADLPIDPTARNALLVEMSPREIATIRIALD